MNIAEKSQRVNPANPSSGQVVSQAENMRDFVPRSQAAYGDRWANKEPDIKGIPAPIIYAVAEFFVLATLALLPVALVHIDVAISGTVGESSITEAVQETLLFTSAMIFWYGAWRHPASRGMLVLVAGFFSCALLRELDGVLDAIWHGFWLWPALAMAVGSITYVGACCRDSVLRPAASFVQTKEYFFIMVGLIILLVFSRTFGGGNLVWKGVMGAAYKHEFKSALQEGLELLGYVFIAYGSLRFFSKRCKV